MKFINRTKEMADLKAYFTQEPNALLFVYGPKSSGKSTLLQKMVTELPHDQFTINFMNLREVLIYDFRTFLSKFQKRSCIFLPSGISFLQQYFSQ